MPAGEGGEKNSTANSRAMRRAVFCLMGIAENGGSGPIELEGTAGLNCCAGESSIGKGVSRRRILAKVLRVDYKPTANGRALKSFDGGTWVRVPVDAR